MRDFVLMVGPDPEGFGGISRVVKTWHTSGLFDFLHVVYISSTDSLGYGKLFRFAKNFLRFISLVNRSRMVYIHTSSRRSFFRKSLFLTICVACGKRVLLHIHPNHFIDFLDGLSGIRRQYSFAILARVDGFITLTEAMRYAIEARFKGKPVNVLNNPVDVASLTSFAGFTRRPGHLIYLGSYLREKGVFELVDAVAIAVAQGRSVTLDYYGSDCPAALLRHVSQRKMQKHIKVNGWISGTAKLKALCEATMLVLPSYSEGIPNVVLEAMATKTPIVATPVGGLVEVLTDGRNAILAEPHNTEDLCEKILKALDNPDLRNDLATQAYQDAITRYDIRIIKPKVVAVIYDTGEF